MEDRRAVRSTLVRGVSIEFVVEDGTDRSVGERTDLDGTRGGGFQPYDTERPRQPQDAEAGSEALLGVRPVLQDKIAERDGCRPDEGGVPADTADSPVGVTAMTGRHMVGSGRVLAIAARSHVDSDPLALDEDLHGAAGEPPLPRKPGLSHLGEHRGEEGIVPPCAFDFAAYGRGARMRAESIECQLAQNGEVLRSVVLAVAGAVLVEDDVEDPVQLVLDTPMGAGDCQHARWRPPSRQQEVSNNWWLLGIADPALQLDTCERFDSREVVLARESCRRHDHRLAPFVAAMAAGKRLLYLRMFCQRLQQYLRVGKQRRLVGLERQSVLSATVENALGKLGVAVQRVGGDSAAIECQQLQGFQCCGDLVALGRQPLGNRKPRLGGPHVDQLQRRRFAATLERTAQGFAVHRHHAVQLLGKFRQEPAKYWFECLRVEQPEYPAEGIVAWDAVLQPQELAQQSFLGTAKLRHVGAVVRSAQHRRQRNDQNVDQIVPRIVRSRVRHVLEKVLEFLHRTTPIPIRESSSESISPASATPPLWPNAIPLPASGGGEHTECAARFCIAGSNKGSAPQLRSSARVAAASHVRVSLSTSGDRVSRTRA